ncbi:MAG: FABP family protein [Actinomycetota bacterium]|nr:FABP family protein [Actinomycetota bacterium]
MIELAPELEPLSCLVGTWRGGGHGEFPTIDAFEYGEWMCFEHVGDTFLMSAQRSWLVDDGSPLHLERGFWRPGSSAGRLEVTLAHPLGLTEIAEGTVKPSTTGTSIELTTREIGRTSTGMDVVALTRRYSIEVDVMSYEIDMATGSTPMARHLTAELRREPD